MRADLLLAALASAAASLACVTPAVDPVPTQASSPEAVPYPQVEASQDRVLPALGVVSSDGCLGCLAFPPIDAVVLEVKPGLVVLDKGKQDGVKVGYGFAVYLGSTLKGVVRISDVQEGTSVGTIRSMKSPIERGDSATTGL